MAKRNLTKLWKIYYSSHKRLLKNPNMKGYKTMVYLRNKFFKDYKSLGGKRKKLH